MVGPAGEAGLDEAAVRTWETLHLGDEFEVEAGSTEVLGRFAEQSSDAVVAALPDARVGMAGRAFDGGLPGGDLCAQSGGER